MKTRFGCDEWKLEMAEPERDQQKNAIRKKMRERRRAQDASIRDGHSLKIMESLLQRNEFREAEIVLIYLSTAEEVATDELLARSLAAGKRVLAPVVNTANGELDLAEVPGSDAAFRKGPFGMREPAGEDITFVPPGQVDLVVVPGLAFDRKGGRVGFGKGYYDRLLDRLRPEVPRVALAFGFQVLETVPQSGSDRRVSLIITETSTMDCSGMD